MAKAKNVLIRCLGYVGEPNAVVTGVNVLDGVDQWDTYLKTEADRLTSSEKAAFEDDAAWSRFGYNKPGTWSRYKDVDSGLSILLDQKGHPVIDERGGYKYYNHATGLTVSMHDIGYKKEKVLWFFTRDAQKMITAPIWYEKVKKIMLSYPDYAQRGGLLSLAGGEMLERYIHMFFANIESGNAPKNWGNILYTAFLDGRGTHWYLMSKMLPGFFDILENPLSIKQYMGIEIDIKDLPDFREAVSALATKSKTSPMTVLDTLGEQYRTAYGTEQPLMFLYEGGKPVEVETYLGKLTKEYLLGLSIDQQIKQLQAIFNDTLNINKFKTFVKLKLWNHPGGYIFKLVNMIGSPSFLAGLMSVAGGLPGFVSLLVLNTSMAVGELISGKSLKGDWVSFSKTHGLGRGIPEVEDLLGTSIGLGAMGRKYTSSLIELYRQGLFNASEPLMVGIYQQNQMARFFKEVFPGVDNWDDVDLLLSHLKNKDIDSYRQMITAAHNYTDHVMGKMFNHYSRSAINNDMAITYGYSRPYIETLISMWHFFSSWGMNKLRGNLEILSAESNRVFNTKLGAQYLDIAFYNPERVTHLRNLMHGEFEYLASKFYRTLKIGKYLERSTESEGEKENEDFFDDVGDMFKFASVFNGDLSAIDSTPYGRIVKNFLNMVTRSIQIDLEGQDGIDVLGATQAGTYAAGLEVFRSFFRKLYLPQMLTEVYSKIEDGALEEKSLGLIMLDAFRKGSTGFLYMLDNSLNVAGYQKDIQMGPGSFLSRVIGTVDPTKEYIMDTLKATKLRLAHKGEFTFQTILMYGLPFAKQYFSAKIKDNKEFFEMLEKYNSSNAVKSIIDGKVPVDAYDSDYKHLYNSLISALPIKRKSVDEDGHFDSSFIKDGKKIVAWQKQSLIDTLHELKKLGVDEEEGNELIKEIEGLGVSDNKKDALYRAMYVTDYIDKKSPGASLLALAYVVNKKVFEGVYLSGKKYDKEKDKELIKKKRDEVIQKVMREYGDYALQVDKYYTQTQFYLHYAKTHNEEISKYISDPGEGENKTLRMVFPDSGMGIKEVNQHIEGYLYAAAAAKEGISDPELLISEFSTLFDINKYKDSEGKLSPEISAYYLNLLSNTTKFIDTLAIPDKQKHALKMSTLTLGDSLYPYILKDKRLMERDDIKALTSDWAKIYFEELKDIDHLAEEMAEDEFENKKFWKRKFGKSSWFRYDKYPRDLLKWKQYLKDQYYNKYHGLNPIKREKRSSHAFDYLRESEFLKAKRSIDLHGIQSLADAKSKAKGSLMRGKDKDGNGILSVGRRGKSIANYVREDIDKPVEYKTPWRKRWVRRGKGVAPISTTTWKHLTPKPPKK